MNTMSEFQTEMCVRCRKKIAKLWTGHVQVEPGFLKVTAGFCSERCRDAMQFDSGGRCGTWKSNMGRIRI